MKSVQAVVYTAAALAAWALLPGETWGLAYYIWSVIFGYLGLLAIAVVGYLKLKLCHWQSFYKLRVGDYRVIYRIEREVQATTIFIEFIRHRREVYK